jgi:ABC-type xylose transport system substrate-binding protein
MTMPKKITITGVNSEQEEVVMCDIMEVENGEQIARRIESSVNKGADTVIIVLPCASVYNQNVKSKTDAQIAAIANRVYRTLNA